MMKNVWMIVRLALPVAAIVLLAMSLIQDEAQPWLSLGMLCSCTGLWLNIYCQRMEKSK